jgi:cytochrome b
MAPGLTAGADAGRTLRPAEADAAPRTESGMVRVWDPFVRLFHWSLVVFFTAAWLTGDEIDWLHELLGYGVLALVGLRLVWGFVGSPHARFRDFSFGPATTFAYARDALAMRAKRYLGHNPLGAAMVFALLAGLVVTGGSGWLLTTDLLGHEPKWLEETHEVAANLMLVLIATHIAGVIFSSLSHGENLARSMVSGMKRAE